MDGTADLVSAELIGVVLTREERLLAVIEQTYPAYRVVRMVGGYLATRHRPPTAEERALGIIGSIGRPDALSLSSALSAQLGIMSQRGQA